MLGDADAAGQMVMLTGPRSVGKSLMLRKMAAELKAQKCHVVVFDARQHGTDLVRGIVPHLTRDKALLNAAIAQAPDAAAVDITVMAAAVAKPSGVAEPGLLSNVRALLDTAMNAILSRMAPGDLRFEQLLGPLLRACARRGEHPIIVIDEANVVALAATNAVEKQRRWTRCTC